MAGGGAGKIELFKFIQKTYQDIGLNPPQSYENRNPINAKNCFFLFCLAQFFISSAAYLVFEANSMIAYGMAFFTSASIIFYFILYLIFIWQMTNILNYIENCERFMEKRMHSAIVYRETTEKIERLTEYFAYVLSTTNVILVLPALPYTLVNYYALDAGKESFFLFFPTWWPFDWKTPCGYLVAWLGECAGVAALAITAISFFNIIFGSCWLFIVIAKDITNDVAAFNITVKALKEDGCDRAALMECFYNLIQYYAHAKKCVNHFNEISEYSLFAFFSWDMLSISSLLVALQFQLWDDDSKLVEILMLSILIPWLFVVSLAICEPGERVTNQFEQFDEELGRCEWNKLPLGMQRIYLIFLSDTHQPKNIRCYGGIKCTRDTFKQITTKGFSYFMTLRKFQA